MVVKQISSVNIDPKNISDNRNINSNKQILPYYVAQKEISDKVSFGSAATAAAKEVKDSLMVRIMDFTNSNYAVSFLIGDGLGFIIPRVGDALFYGGEIIRDENGNPVLDKKGNPKRKMNIPYARKEATREIITGPSAYVIPLLGLAAITKNFGTANNVKVNAIHAFSDLIKDENLVQKGELNKSNFDAKIYEHIVGKDNAKEFIEYQNQYHQQLEKLSKASSKAEKKAIKEEMGNIVNSISARFIELVKGKDVNANVIAVELANKDKKTALGTINKLPGMIEDYYGDLNNSIKNNQGKDVEALVESFKKTKSGSRLLTIFGLFAAVSLFYTQIPKLYNMGLKGNPALANMMPETDNQPKNDVTFNGNGAFLTKLNDTVQNNGFLKKVSNFFELDGPIINGGPMSVLLYGFCIPPRLMNAQDKYDYKDIIVRDMTSFAVLLFGAKALSRVFTDVLMKKTGLVLNEKYNKGDNVFKKIIGYIQPSDSKHHILSGTELNGKYTNIDHYKGGIKGFVEFLENNGGNVKKALSHDENVKKAAFNAIKANSEYASVKSYEELSDAAFASLKDIKDAKLKSALEETLKNSNKLLKKAKNCNSIFGFISTFILVPGFIFGLGKYCKKMTEKRIAEANKDKLQNNNQNVNSEPKIVKLNNTPQLEKFMRA